MDTPKAPPVAIPDGKRWCYWVPVEQRDHNGYYPSVVVEGEAEHKPLAGNGDLASPWYWGKTFNEAQLICDEENRKIGISPSDALEIIMSMNRAGLRGRRRSPGSGCVR